MNSQATLYSLHLRPVGAAMDSADGISELEVIAQPAGPGRARKARFRQWEPVLDRICATLGFSPFHRKAMHRTLFAGLPADMIDRSNGHTRLFSSEELAALELNQAEELDSAA
jgi:hypothetical protein